MAAKNNIVRTIKLGSVIHDASGVIDSNVSINQGDLICLLSNKLATATTEATDAVTFLGVSPVTIVSGKLQTPYTGTAVDAAVAASAVPGPVHGVICKLTLKTSDALTAGGLVYLNPAGGTQHVSSTGSKAIGVYQGATISSASAGQQVEVHIGHRYPADTLVGI